MSTDISATDPRDQELAALRQRVAELEAEAATHAFDLAIGRSLRSLIPDSGVFIFDNDLRFVVVNAPALKRIGVDDAAMVGHTIWELMPPNVVALLEGPYRGALRGEISSFIDSFAGGVYRFNVVPIHDEAGQIIAGMALLRDVTAQAAAEEQMHIFEQLVEHAPDGIIVRQADRLIRYTNPAIAALLDYETLTGQLLDDVIAPESRPEMAQIGTQLVNGAPWRGRLVYKRADGTTFPATVTVFALNEFTSENVLVGAIVRDVSHIEQAERERQEQLLAAQQAVIRELATPLIPLANEVIAMPLVGTIDSGRVQQIMETLLEGIVEHQASFAILDITGVKIVDTHVAQSLVRIAQATKLLGAQLLLSGIGAEIAMTLTHLEADLTGIISVSNLQQAIAYALAQQPGEAFS